ncbi:MAG TPA: sugar phosphate isomerase/epimerase, partial [Candidatus Omnitrophica bacterium]|nr:sugar phosphate isomerase/epimerase [Candidatus Omnitrophota bacterium]
MKIGAMLESFRLPSKEAIEKTRQIGAKGLQISTVKGEFAPENLSKSGRKDLLDFLTSYSLQISALCGDLGGHGFTKEEENSWRIARTKEIIDLALDLRVNVVTTHIGVIPEDRKDARYETLQSAMKELGEYGDKKEVNLAIETGPETPEILLEFIESLRVESIKVNYDPANLVMVTGVDPVKGVSTLGKYIVHTHAKDGIRISSISPEVIYDYFAEGGIGDIRLSDYFKEV